MKKIILIQLIEDYTLIRNTLKRYLNTQNNLVVTESFSSVFDYLHQPLRDCRSDVVIVDLNFNGSEGFDEIAKIRKFSPETKIVVMITEHSENEIEKLLNAGADKCFALEDGYENIALGLKEMFKNEYV